MESINNRRVTDVAKVVFQILSGVLTVICAPLAVWALSSTVQLQVGHSTEKAIRETENRAMQKSVDDFREDMMKFVSANKMENEQRHIEIVQNSEKQIAILRLDWEKRMSDYRMENDRRFLEIQKQLEQANLKLDKALEMLLSGKLTKNP